MADPFLTQRPVLNLNFSTLPADYAFINRIQQATNYPGPFGANFSVAVFNQLIDATTGIPNAAGATGHTWGGGFVLPASSNFSGPWNLTWSGGDATFQNGTGTYTELNLVTAGTATFTSGNPSIAFANSFDSTVVAAGKQQIIFTTSVAGFTANQIYYVLSTGLSGTTMQVSATAGGAALVPNVSTTATVNGTYTRVSNGNWQSANGVVPLVYFNITAVANPTINSFQINSLGTNGFPSGFKFYEQADEADLLAGKIFRTAFKQPIVFFNPGAIRFMNWLGGNTDLNCRFENRTLPMYQGYTGVNWIASPFYSPATVPGGVPNQYVLAAVNTGARQTPAVMTHGELVTCRMDTAGVRFGSKTVTNVTQAVGPTGGVVSCTGHGFSTGDLVCIFMTRNSGGNFSGMAQLNMVPFTVTVIDANSFSTGVNTSGFTAWDAVAGGGTAFAEQFVTLNVGGRGTFPVVTQDGNSIVSRLGSIALNDYKSFVFDKTISAQGNGSGGWVMGAWVIKQGSGTQPFVGDVPLEICTTLVNEINAMSVAPDPVHMWINLPVMSMLSMDPDYSSGSNWATNCVSVILNGANGYAGLNAASSLIVEYSNEIWNPTVVTQYIQWRGYQRWLAPNLNDFQDLFALRSTCAMRDIKAAFPGNARLNYVFGIWGPQAMTPGAFGGNYERCFGNASAGQTGNYYTTDSLVTGGSWGTPISNHDAVCPAPYIDVPTAYMTGSGTGSFTDDSAMYAGTAPYGSPNTATAISNFVGQTSTGGTQISGWLSAITTYASVMTGVGKKVVNYEGGFNWPTNAGASYQGHTLTAADSTFITAATNSASWSTAQLGFFTSYAAISGCFLPSIYIHVSTTNTNQQWAYCAPDSYATIVSVPTEGAALTLNSPFWAACGLKNRNKRRFVVKTG